MRFDVLTVDVPADALKTFNSLYEIRRWQKPITLQYSKTTFNSLYEIHDILLTRCIVVNMTFNSLYEIQYLIH